MPLSTRGFTRRRRRVRALAVALVPALVAASACDTAREAVELVAEGGLIELREPLRPIRGTQRVVVFGLDGVGHNALEEAFANGRFPMVTERLERVGGRPDPVTHPMTTVLPSITLAAWTTLFTGEPPSVTGVPGNEWFDRDSALFRAPAPVSVSGSADALSTLTDGAIGRWSPPPTLFERANLRSHVSLLPVHRGADLLSVPDAEDLAELMGAFVEGVVADETVERETFEEVDRGSAEEAVKTLEEHGVPDLQVVYFPGVDLYTHAAEDPLASQQRYIAEVLDPAMARLIDAYQAADAWAGTWLVIVADHGHTPVPGDRRHALGASGGLPDLLDSLGWRPRAPELETDAEDFQSVVAYEGAFAYVYLTDRTVCPRPGDACDWTRRATGEEVDEVAETIRRSAAGGEEGLGGSLEMILIPRRDAEGRFQRVDRWDENGARDLASVTLSDSPAHFRLKERLEWLFDGLEGDRAGDIVLLARSGSWVPEEGRFYFSHPYRSWHGSPAPSDSRVGLVVERAGAGEPAVLPADLTQLDFTDLVLGLLREPGR